jgi:membrane-associated phospholipid phosphatase
MASPPATAIETERLTTGADEPWVEEPWRAQLARRVRGHPLLTFIGTSAFIFVFFLGYFYVQQHPAFVSTVMPLTSLDSWIPFQPLALVAYLSLWIYVGAGPGLQATRTDMLAYASWMGALCLTGLTIFYLLPTQVADVIGAESDSIFFRLLDRVDASGNACPSMHVAAAVFTAIRVDDVLRVVRSPPFLRLLNLGLCGLICYSTLAIKQHVVLDVVAGALLGALFAGLSRLAWRAAPADAIARNVRSTAAYRRPPRRLR